MDEHYCDECETVHDDTLSGKLGCLRRQAEVMGATGMVDQVDALERDVHERRDEAIRRYFTE